MWPTVLRFDALMGEEYYSDMNFSDHWWDWTSFHVYWLFAPFLLWLDGYNCRWFAQRLFAFIVSPWEIVLNHHIWNYRYPLLAAVRLDLHYNIQLVWFCVGQVHESVHFCFLSQMTGVRIIDGVSLSVFYARQNSSTAEIETHLTSTI